MDPKILCLEHAETSPLMAVQDHSPHGDAPSEAVISPLDWRGDAVTAPIWTKMSWTNDAITKLGDVKSGLVMLLCLRPRTVVIRALLSVTSAARMVRDLSVSLGVIPPPYNDYIDKADGKIVGVTKDKKAGQPDVLSLTDCTCLYLSFATRDALADVVGSAGDVYIETIVLP